MEETKQPENSNTGSSASGETKKKNFFRGPWTAFALTAVVALIVGFAIGHCCHRRHHHEGEWGSHAMMMRGGWGHGPQWGMGPGEMRGMEPGGMHGPMGMRGDMGMHHDFDPAERANHMKEMLGLNDQQTQQLTTLFTDQKNKMESAMKNMDSTRGQDWRADREQMESQIKAILTPDQQAKWQQMMAARMGHDK